MIEYIFITCCFGVYGAAMMFLGAIAVMLGLQLKYGIKDQPITERIQELINKGIWYENTESTQKF